MEEEVRNSELARSLARIEMKLDRTADDHEMRLRRVERWVWIATGLSMAGMISGVLAQIQTGAGA
jgi:hypothetical protein